MPRAVTFVLALMVSPLGVAVCEVVCGTPALATGHHAAATSSSAGDADAHHTHHDHHGHDAHTPVAPVTSALDVDGAVTLSGPECEPLSGTPARVRHAFSGLELQAVAVSHISPVADTAMPADRRQPVPQSGPPEPPRHAPVPLRI